MNIFSLKSLAEVILCSCTITERKPRKRSLTTTTDCAKLSKNRIFKRTWDPRLFATPWLLCLLPSKTSSCVDNILVAVYPIRQKRPQTPPTAKRLDKTLARINARALYRSKISFGKRRESFGKQGFCRLWRYALRELFEASSPVVDTHALLFGTKRKEPSLEESFQESDCIADGSVPSLDPVFVTVL